MWHVYHMQGRRRVRWLGSFFDKFLSTQLDALKKCREEFRDCYGDELIEKFKQNGYAAMKAKIEKQNAVDKIRNEKYREENQNRYQYKEMYDAI